MIEFRFQFYMMNISFEDSRTAFAYKTDKELKRAEFLFELMRKEWLVKLGLWLTPVALRLGLPVKGLIRKTIFKQFVGGKDLQETLAVAEKLGQFNVKVILDYGVEGKEGEENFDKAAREFIKVILHAATQQNIPFTSVKLSGLARVELLQKISEASGYDFITQGKLSLGTLDETEKKEWAKVAGRLQRICETAERCNIGVLIDAEESWIQAAADGVSMQMMRQFNTRKAVVYNTVQLYRKDRVQFIKDCCRFAVENNCKPGLKLVRGAYMEKERMRATELNYPSPVHDTKEATDDEYNRALEYCTDPANGIYIVIGSHNEHSNLYATELMKKYGLPLDYNRIHFSQLYGMSDNITFNLAKAGCRVSKYLPFGPIEEVIPYLMRRARENSSVSGHTGRQLLLIKKEIKRRDSKNLF